VEANRGSSRHAGTVTTSVMYIDDEDALAYLMTRVLGSPGYRVSGFTDAQHALRVLRERPGDFDVVVEEMAGVLAKVLEH